MVELKNVKEAVKLTKFTTYKIGGNADYYTVVTSKKDLVDSIVYACKNKIPYFVLGTGANILVGDNGFRGLVIHNQTNHIDINDNAITAESGTSIEELVNITFRLGLSGFEHFAGIPSSVGGAIRQNLHFLSPDRKSTVFIESIVKSAKILDTNDLIKKVDNKFFEFGYDDSILHHKEVIVLEVTFELQNKPAKVLQECIKNNLVWRSAKQPNLKGFPSCGSVFKKIQDVGAGRLIEQAGLKGKRIGNAMVSDKHANYIVNMGGATARDVRSLIELVQKEVERKTGYFLEPEISFVGEF